MIWFDRSIENIREMIKEEKEKAEADVALGVAAEGESSDTKFHVEKENRWNIISNFKNINQLFVAVT